jgi:hypothetical protein
MDGNTRGTRRRFGCHPFMTTKLDAPLKRELAVDGEPYTLTLSPEGLKLVPKGHRKGQELSWRAILNGDAALASALSASLERTDLASRHEK